MPPDFKNPGFGLCRFSLDLAFPFFISGKDNGMVLVQLLMTVIVEGMEGLQKIESQFSFSFLAGGHKVSCSAIAKIRKLRRGDKLVLVVLRA